LLASDLDGTLIPPRNTVGDGGIGGLQRAIEGRMDLAIAYVTGRSLALALEGITRHRLPPPGILVCDVGTSVFVAEEGAFVPDPAYRELMLEALGGTAPRSVRDRLAELPGLELQEEEKQAEFKLSYYVPGGHDVGEAAALAGEILEGEGLFNVVHSVDPLDGRGLLDVLPRGVAKDVAVRYLHDRSGVPEEDLVYAGDSGNDAAAMLSGFNVVVVGNADEELKRSIRDESSRLGIADRVYFARASFAAGVLEGCRRFEIL
jgi:HAD superfamily hydrolase (TIGR01484 family)